MKICIYYNYDYTMGHPTRLWALIQGLKKQKKHLQIAIISGGDHPTLVPIEEQASIFSLPYSLHKKAIHIEKKRLFYERIVSSGRLHLMVEKRIALMREILMDFKPDIFLTECFPLGEEFWTFEIPLLLERYRKSFPFQIVGSSGYLSYQSQMYEHIQKYYDQVFVHSPKEFDMGFVDFIPERLSKTIQRTLIDFQDKISFTGFVLDMQSQSYEIKKIRNQYLQKNQKLVFVSRGGGIVNKKIILTSCVLAKDRKDLFFLICCGPATADAEWTSYQQLIRGHSNIHLIRQMSLQEFDQCVFASDLCIAMSGYNTAVRLLYTQKPAVIIPHTSFEQSWRAKQMKKYLPLVVLSSKDLTKKQLSDALDQLLVSYDEKETIPKEWFLGVSQTVERLICRNG